MSEPTSGKEPELPSAYYTHKRSALLAAGALLALCLSKPSKVPTISFDGVSIDIGGDVTLFLLAATALYYTILFIVLWRTDSRVYARAKAGSHPQLEAAAAAQIEMLAKVCQDISNSVSSMTFSIKQISTQQFLRTMSDDLGSAEVDEVLRSLATVPLGRGWALDGLIERLKQRYPDDFDAHVEFEAAINLAIPETYRVIAEALSSAGKQRDGLYNQPIDRLTASAPEFVAIMQGLHRTLNQLEKPLQDITRAVRATAQEVQFRLLWLDLIPCLSVTGLALAHYIGRYYPCIPITLADVPKILGLIDPSSS